MNYYSRNLGDYAKDAGHLSALGHGIYTLLMDWYYGTERPIPHEDAHDIARCSPDEVAPILRKFFLRDGDVWRHKRIEAEIAAYRAKSEKAKAAGRSGGLAKAKQLDSECQADAKQTLSGRLANQEPITNKEQKPPYIPQRGNEAGEQTTKPKHKAITLKTFLSECGNSGEAPIPEDDPIFEYAEKVGLPDRFLHLAWGVFQSKYINTSQRQASGVGWRQKFRNAVEGNWSKLWYMNGSGWELTTAGKQAELAHGDES